MASQRKARVMVADSESAARMGLVRMLEMHEEVIPFGEADSLNSARDLAAKHRPEVIVFDPTMGDSYAFLKELHIWSSGTAVVAHTNRCDGLSVQRALKAGVCGYVSRRDPIAAIMEAIVAATRGERYIGPFVQRMLIEGLAMGAMEMRGNDASSLSNRELQVFRLLGQGLGTKAVAHELKVSIKTVETHRQRIREKLRLPNGSELQRRAVLYCDEENVNSA